MINMVSYYELLGWAKIQIKEMNNYYKTFYIIPFEYSILFQ